MTVATDLHAATELSLYLDNEQPCYKMKQDIARNLLRKMKSGSYAHARAAQAWSYVVEFAAKRYAKEFGGVWHKMFPPDVRLAVAQDLADRWHANAKAGRPDEV